VHSVGAGTARNVAEEVRKVGTQAFLWLILSWRVLMWDSAAVPGRQRSPHGGLKQQHAAWVLQSLQRMEAVKPSMTRANLLNVFRTEGGLSNPLSRTYVYRECPYFKVDVEFGPVGRPARDADGRVTQTESGADVIKKISKPYLARMVLD
jgi:hypothetical protein